MECKSGYGLDAQNEIKMLRVLERAKKNLPIEISSTFCGAHSVPTYVHHAIIYHAWPNKGMWTENITITPY